MRLAAATLVFALSAGSAALRAAPLDDAACTSLNAERDALIAHGLRSDMAHGAEWAKANLSAERMKEIEHLIEVEEQLIFRCPHSKLASPFGKALLKKKDQASKGPDKDQVDDNAEAGSPPSQSSSPGEPAPNVPAKKKRASSKPKASDAKVPPPGGGGTGAAATQ